MSDVTERKRKWDDAPEEKPTLVDAAAQAGSFRTLASNGHSVLTEYLGQTAAIAARIASQHGAGSPAPKEEKKDAYDGAFTHDIDINDLRNRYLITKGSTQQEVRSPYL
jgi:hypothetical protein